MNRIETMPRSVSQTEQWFKCGWRFFLQRVERVTPLPAAWSMHGTAFHSAAEAVERSGRRMSEAEAVELFSDEYEALVNKALDLEPNTDWWLSASGTGAEDIEARYILGQEQTRRYVEWARESQPAIWQTAEEKPALELYFKVELGGVLVRGYIDQLVAEPDASVRVRDLKTGSMKSKFQLETYKVATEAVHGVTVKRGDWYLAKKGSLSKPVDLTEVTADQVGEKYAAMDAGVKAGKFEASPGFLCKFCDMKHKCSFFGK
ncbi:PD-(D/E)XK nuclease family protein [Kitasatospora purpeofusca]|uniref:RecB family exonuclease n=1 Tax=Kitasatospora purpeofusca TaxID=67352 RepID=UPI0022544BE8|nr:PD-(D/E)XK nuclease family protein [Kitasatospora purpeofusca]MCX4685460.1 PD-(D/E)XK nuclease family protein [Kitasatospora purpeofusca]